MQPQRRKILDLLKTRGSATVEELRKELAITSVTVRHHLDVLRSEGWVAEPEVRHRSQSGRPQHVYSLTHKAASLFPHNYIGLAEALLEEIQATSDARQANVIFEGTAARLTAHAPRPAPGEPAETRLDKTIDFLNQKGYVAHWEQRPEGYLITACNCPFDSLVGAHPELCQIDLQFMSLLTGSTLERVCHRVDGDSACAFLLKAG